MSETVTDQEVMAPEELDRQKDAFLGRVVALYGIFGEDETHIENRVTSASIELSAPPALRFAVHRKDGAGGTSSKMGRDSDYNYLIGLFRFDSTNPLKVDRITATVKAWLHEQPELIVTFESNDRAYYDTYTAHGQKALDSLAIDIEPVETET